MEVISKIPEKRGIVGTKEIVKAAKSGAVTHIVVASNCPDFLIERLSGLEARIERFDGDQSQLGTKLGKPFPVAMAGFGE